MKKKIEKKFNIDDLCLIERINFNFIRINLEKEINKEKFINKIIESIIGDTFYIGIYLYSDIKDNILSKNKDSLIKRGIYNYLDFSYLKYIKEDEIYCYLNIFKGNIELIKKVNKALLEKDFSIEPILYLNAYYFDLENNFIFNLYDDRGIDILFLSKEKLNNIGKKLKKMGINYYTYYK